MSSEKAVTTAEQMEGYGPCENCGYPRMAHEWKLPDRHCADYRSPDSRPSAPPEGVPPEMLPEIYGDGSPSAGSELERAYLNAPIGAPAFPALEGAGKEEPIPSTVREWLEDALGRYQVTHVHSSVREALKLLAAPSVVSTPEPQPEAVFKSYIWRDRLKFVAFAHARSVQEARELLDAEGAYGDASTPVRQEMGVFVKTHNPEIFYRGVAEAILTDSGELEEIERAYENSEKELKATKAQLASL